MHRNFREAKGDSRGCSEQLMVAGAKLPAGFLGPTASSGIHMHFCVAVAFDGAFSCLICRRAWEDILRFILSGSVCEVGSRLNPLAQSTDGFVHHPPKKRPTRAEHPLRRRGWDPQIHPPVYLGGGVETAGM